jgi:hypothetical protein
MRDTFRESANCVATLESIPMAKMSISIVVKRSWWVLPYMSAVELFGELMGLTPDYDKVVSMAMRGISIKMVDNQ